MIEDGPIKEVLVYYWDILVGAVVAVFLIGRIYSRQNALHDKIRDSREDLESKILHVEKRHDILRSELLAAIRQTQVDQRESNLELRHSMDHQFSELRKDLRSKEP